MERPTEGQNLISDSDGIFASCNNPVTDLATEWRCEAKLTFYSCNSDFVDNSCNGTAQDILRVAHHRVRGIWILDASGSFHIKRDVQSECETEAR